MLGQKQYLLSIFKDEFSLKWFSTLASNEASKENITTAKPFDDVPSLKMLPLIGTAWAVLPFISTSTKIKLHSFNVNMIHNNTGMKYFVRSKILLKSI